MPETVPEPQERPQMDELTVLAPVITEELGALLREVLAELRKPKVYRLVLSLEEAPAP